MPTLRKQLAAIVTFVGVFVIGGVAYQTYVPHPPEVTRDALVDAGLVADRLDRFICTQSEKTDKRTQRKLRAEGFDLRPKQVYARVARVCYTHQLFDELPDGGMVAVTDGGLGLVAGSERLNLGDFSADDGGDDGEQPLQYRPETRTITTCAAFDGGLILDGGWAYGGANPCGAIPRVYLVPAPCMIPDCRTLPDGGWNDDSPAVDCKCTGPFGEQDGGPRWRGCNVTPRQYATGSACIPVECGVVAGDRIEAEWL